MGDVQVSRPRQRPVVVQHSFGDLGSGGPIGALTRVLDSPLAETYEFVGMHQQRATGGLDWSRVREWSDMLREVRPDLVHVRGLGNEGLHGVLAAKAAGCPKILVSVHGTVRDLAHRRSAKQQMLVSVAEPLTLRLATHVTTVCEYAASRPFVQRHAHKFVGPIVNGVKLPADHAAGRRETRRRLGLDEDAVVMISVGRLTWDKGHRDLAAALRQTGGIPYSGITLLVAGDGPHREEIARDYEACGVDVRLLGRRSDVEDLLRASDVFVFPTLHENLSNALLEAMASGLPVVATAVGGNVEVLERGGGILVRPGYPGGLADALSMMALDGDLRSRLGADARRVVASHYSMEAMCDSIDTVYRQILEEAR